MELMWVTGARISEILGLRPSCIKENEQGFFLVLSSLKQGVGRPSKRVVSRNTKRHVPIVNPGTRDRIRSYLYMNRIGRGERLFKMSRPTVHRRIKNAVERSGWRGKSISAHSFRHSFAVHLVLHGRPLKVISHLLGHRSVKSTEIYTRVLTADVSHFMEGIDFH